MALPGAVLATVGVSPPLMQPEQVVLLHVAEESTGT